MWVENILVTGVMRTLEKNDKTKNRKHPGINNASMGYTTIGMEKNKREKNTRRGCAIITTSVFRPQRVREYTYGRIWFYALFVYESHAAASSSLPLRMDRSSPGACEPVGGRPGACVCKSRSFLFSPSLDTSHDHGPLLNSTTYGFSTSILRVSK